MTSQSTAPIPGAHDGPLLCDMPFAEVLMAELDTAATVKKGERTRKRLVAAAAQVLEQQGFHNMRVTDACKIAGVSQGTFYLYFENKSEISRAVLHDFNQRGLSLLSETGPNTDPFQAIYDTTLTLARLYRQNPGLMQCLWQINDEAPDFGEILRDANAVWIRAIAQSITRRCGLRAQDARNALFVAYALGAMVDQFLVSLYVARDPHVAELKLNEEQAAELLSVLWYRAAFCSDPPEGALKFASSLENFHLITP